MDLPYAANAVSQFVAPSRISAMIATIGDSCSWVDVTQLGVKDGLGSIGRRLGIACRGCPLSLDWGSPSFLIPSHFIDGGGDRGFNVVGECDSIPLPFVMMLVNGPFVALGYQHIGKSFALRSCFAIAGLALCIWLIPFPVANP